MNTICLKHTLLSSDDKYISFWLWDILVSFMFCLLLKKIHIVQFDCVVPMILFNLIAENHKSMLNIMVTYVSSSPCNEPPTVAWILMTSWNGNVSTLQALCVRGIHRSPLDSLYNEPVIQTFDVFLYEPNKLLNKHSSGWFDTPWRSSDISVMSLIMITMISKKHLFILNSKPQNNTFARFSCEGW